MAKSKPTARPWVSASEPPNEVAKSRQTKLTVTLLGHDQNDSESRDTSVYGRGNGHDWVTVGTNHDTSAFAVSTLRQWWDTVGSVRYPDATQLLITADGGGSNGYRIRAWKMELAKFAAETGLEITVCHLPPGTSKWNKIEHRLFSQITMKWRGRPLKTHQIIVDLISSTTTETGLTVQCVLDTDQYPLGVKYTKKDVEALPLTRHEFHGEWNYTLSPHDTP